MKIRIELDENLIENELVIRCKNLDEEVQRIQQIVSEAAAKGQQITFYKGDTEYYLSMEDILFFETEGSTINVHTRDNIYRTKLKLYELEEMLPGNFMRVSKQAILNINKIYAIDKNISASSLVHFKDTHKQVYVSRYYFKPLKNRLDEKRIG